MDNDGNGDTSGHVRVYHLDDSGSYIEAGNKLEMILMVKLQVIESGRCCILSADGTTVAIGALMEMMVMGSLSGHVRVYHLDDSGSSSSWVQRLLE